MSAPDPLAAAVLTALGRRPTSATRRRMAHRLRDLADHQERLANIQAEQQARPAGARLTPRQRTAGPGRPPANFVRLEHVEDRGRERLRLYVGRALWYAIGSPRRIDIQRLGGEVRITPGDEYALTAGSGIPRTYVDGSRDLLADVEDGRHEAKLRGRIIVISLKTEGA